MKPRFKKIGIGALVIKKGTPIKPILFGGGHERGMRPSTLNVSGIVGLGEACRLRESEMVEDESAIALKRDRLQALLQEEIPDLKVIFLHAMQVYQTVPSPYYQDAA